MTNSNTYQGRLLESDRGEGSAANSGAEIGSTNQFVSTMIRLRQLRKRIYALALILLGVLNPNLAMAALEELTFTFVSSDGSGVTGILVIRPDDPGLNFNYITSSDLASIGVEIDYSATGGGTVRGDNNDTVTALCMTQNPAFPPGICAIHPGYTPQRNLFQSTLGISTVNGQRRIDSGVYPQEGLEAFFEGPKLTFSPNLGGDAIVYNGVTTMGDWILGVEEEPTVTLSIGSTNILEDGETSNIVVTLSEALGEDVTVTLAYSGTATPGVDYAAPTTSLTIVAGQLSANTFVETIDDVLVDPAETIIIDIVSVTNAAENGEQQQTVTIDNDDVESFTFIFTGSNGVTGTLTMDLATAPDQTFTYDGIVARYDDSDEEAEYLVSVMMDFTAIGGNVYDHTWKMIADFQLCVVNFVPTGPGSAGEECSEEFLDPAEMTSVYTNGPASLGRPTGGSTLGQKTLDGGQFVDGSTFALAFSSTVGGDDVQFGAFSSQGDWAIGEANSVTLSVGSASIGEAGATSTITATLNQVASEDVTVNLGFSGTATGGVDYPAPSNSITIVAGQLSANATIGVGSIEDALIEDNETIIIDIASVTNAVENGVQQQTVTITDDDAPVAPVIPVSFVAADGQVFGAVINSGTLSDVTVNAGSTVIGGTLDGDIVSSGTIVDAIIAEGATVEGGRLQKTITNKGEIKNVILDKDSRIEGGKVSGTITGSPDQFGLVNATIDSDTVLENITIGADAIFTNDLQLGSAVRFESAENIPAGINLVNLLESVPFAQNSDLLGVDLDTSIFADDGDEPPITVLGSIELLDAFNQPGVEVKQDPETAALNVGDSNAKGKILPVLVQQAQADAEEGISITEDGDFAIVTATRQEVISFPLVIDEPALRAGLIGANSELELGFDERANLLITDGSAGQDNPEGLATTFIARAESPALPAHRSEELGLHLYPLDDLANVDGVSLIFEDEDGVLFEQNLVPVPEDWLLLKATLKQIPNAEGVRINTDGVISIEINGQIVRARADYVVEESDRAEAGQDTVRFENDGDINGDGTDDFSMIFPNGAVQRLYIYPGQ